MYDNIDTLKQTYGDYGGKDKEFVSQVRDMENYLYYNRPPPLEPMRNQEGVYPY